MFRAMILLPHVGILKSQTYGNNSSFVNSSVIGASTPSSVVNVIQVYSYRYSAVATAVAIDVFRQRLPQLWQKYQLHVDYKSSVKNASRIALNVDPQSAMQVVVKSILDDSLQHQHNNKTYVFGLTFNGPGEARIGALITPIYNLITMSALAMADDIGDSYSFPLNFRICPTSLNMLEAHRRFVQLLQFTSAASVIIDETSVQSFRRLENFLRKDAIPVLTSQVLTQQPAADVAASIVATQPGVILSTFTGLKGAQAMCKVRRNRFVVKN